MRHTVLAGLVAFSTSITNLGVAHAEAISAVNSRPGILEHFYAARKYDPQYLAAFAARDAAEQGLALADAAFGPKVSLSGSSFRTNRVEESTNFFGQKQEKGREFSSHLAQIQARQSIYRSRDHKTSLQAIAQAESAQSVLQYAEQDLAYRLLNRWVEVLAAREQVIFATEALTAANEYLKETERRQKSGESTIQELDLAKARAMQSDAQIAEARAQLEVAEILLADIAGPGARVPNALSIKGLNTLKHSRFSDQALMDLIEEQNFEVIAARFQEEAARLEREKASADRKPTLDAYVTVSKGENDSVSSVKDESRIGLQFSMPLYMSGAIDAAVAQADANYRKAQAQARATLLRVRSEALAANNSLLALGSRVVAADRSAQAAALVLQAQERGLRAGINSRAEVAQSRQELISAQRQQVAARRDYFTNWLKLQQTISSFNDPMLASIEAAMSLNALVSR